MLVTNTAWKLRESHWGQGRYSYSSADSYEFTHVYSSKKRAIKRMKELLGDWVERMEERKNTTTTILLETNEHVTAMSYDSKFDSWSLIDIILYVTNIG